MSIARIASVWCDAERAIDCQRWIAQEADTEVARRIARAHGWVRRPWRDGDRHRPRYHGTSTLLDVCPRCQRA